MTATFTITDRNSDFSITSANMEVIHVALLDEFVRDIHGEGVDRDDPVRDAVNDLVHALLNNRPYEAYAATLDVDVS